ncbi:aminotransferase class V-fold PLP-dependent enzyme [Patescibacteria group bacterium]|nr:aminotransferase class V-fold PLP-dependent enzyme [Patescibacteria group bacterium]
MFWKKKRVYLDFAAGTAGNPSSAHEEGRRAKRMLEDARRRIAERIEAQADDVIFTSGATESNALAILGAVRAAANRGVTHPHVLYLPSAHASIVENVRLLAEEGSAIDPLPIKDARVDTDALAKMIRPETVLITMDAVCGETGAVWNTREVADMLKKRGTGKAVLHTDASQAPWTEKMTRAHFGADLLTFDGAKIGVRGIGALVAHRTIPLAPLYRGGGQERGLRSGSENPEAARKFAAALCAAASGREAFRLTARAARARLLAALHSSFPSLHVNEGREQAPNILNVSFPGTDMDYAVALLDEAGFALSTKSACETDSLEGSRAVFALTGDRERARSTLRISWGPEISVRELEYFAGILARTVGFIDTNRAR